MTGRRGEGDRRTGMEVVGTPEQHGDADVSTVLLEALSAAEPVERWTHGFHTYPAGLHPDAAARLIAAFPGDILDPFCGGGTVMVEGRAAGRRTVGRDLSDVALLVARARTSAPDEELTTTFRSAARRITEHARTAQIDPPSEVFRVVEQWYAPYVMRELQALRTGIAEAPESVRAWLWACFSSTLVKVSWRQSDTSALRVKHRRPPETTAILFHKKARELGRRWAAYREAVPEDTPRTELRRADARALKLSKKVDAVITSPPYPSTYDYLPLQHLRSVWLGHPQVEGEIGARRAWRAGSRSAERAWAADTVAWTARAAAALRPGGALVVVIGDGLTPAGPVDSAQPTRRAARAAGMTELARVTVVRADHGRDSTRAEHALAFRAR